MANLWPAAWRANLPWAGVPGALAQILNIHGVLIPGLSGEIGKLQEGTWQIASKAITPDNGANDLFGISGHVLIRGVVAVVTTAITAAGGAVTGKIGTETVDDALIGATADIRAAVDTVWFDDTGPAATIDGIGLSSAYVIGDEKKIILTCGAKPDTGELAVYLYWMPLSPGASVAAAA